MPASAIPIAQNAVKQFHGLTDADREKVGWRNAFELFPSLKERFPEMI